MKYPYAALALLFASVPSAAQDAAPAAEPPPPADAGPPLVVDGQKDKKICRSERSTGSIMPRRVCRTQSQVAREREESLRALEAAQRLRAGQDLTREINEAGG